MGWLSWGTANKAEVAVAAAAGIGAGAALALAAARLASRRGLGKSVAPAPVWGAAPHPEWTPPQRMDAPAAIANGKMIAIDPRKIGGKRCYPLIISAVVPRPVAFVSTTSRSGAQNLAPFSYFTAFHDPPHVVLCICRSAV